MNPTPPILYGVPKIRKENIPIRPVLSYINAPSYRLCKELNRILPKLTNFKSKYSVKNFFEFINNRKNLLLLNNAKRFDVKNQF